MSNYLIEIDCPYCLKRTQGMAIDDYFGPHGYALKCDKCHTVWHKVDVKSGKAEKLSS